TGVQTCALPIWDKVGKGFLEMDDVLEDYVKRSTTRFGTTIGAVGTDAPLDHEQLARLVELAHDGITLAVRPAHMSTDGDTILGFATGKANRRRLDYRAFDALHHVAVREVAKSAVNAVLSARSLGGFPGFEDLRLLTWGTIPNNAGRWVISVGDPCPRPDPL